MVSGVLFSPNSGITRFSYFIVRYVPGVRLQDERGEGGRRGASAGHGGATARHPRGRSQEVS